MEELVKAIEWYLGRRPRSLAYQLDNDYYLWVTEELSVETVPTVKIVYHVEDTSRTVKLISIAQYIKQP